MNIPIVDPGKSFEKFWNPADNLASLSDNYCHQVNFINSDLAHYKKERLINRTFSKIIKFISIILVVVTTCLPLLNSFSEATQAQKLARANYCFIMLGIAGALFLLDKYFGFTSKWIRLKTTEENLSVALSDFRQDFIVFLATVNGHFTRELYVQAQQKIAALRKKADTIKANEVMDWLKEYQQSMVELGTKIEKANTEAGVNAQKILQDGQTGSLILKISNAQHFDAIQIKVDDLDFKKVVKTSETLIENLAPRLHSLQLMGTLNNKPYLFDKIFEIKPKSTETLSIAIPE